MSPQDTRQAILDAAATLFAVDAWTTLEEVAEKAGVSRPTLYRYFGDRSKLLTELAHEAIERTDQAVAHLRSIPSPAEALLELFDALIPLGSRYRFLTHELIDDPKFWVDYQRQLNETRRFVEWLQTEGLIAAEIPPTWAMRLIDALIYVTWDAVEEGEVARLDAAKLAYRTVVRGIGERSK